MDIKKIKTSVEEIDEVKDTVTKITGKTVDYKNQLTKNVNKIQNLEEELLNLKKMISGLNNKKPQVTQADQVAMKYHSLYKISNVLDEILK